MREINGNTAIKESGETFKILALARQKSKNRKTPKTFKEIFGDLSDFIFEGTLDLTNLNLSSLEGCPTKILNGNFSTETNPNLKSLKDFPNGFESVDMFYLDYDLFKKLHTLEESTKENLTHGIKLLNVLIDPVLTEESEIITHMLIINNFATARANIRLIDLQYNILKVNQEKVRQQKQIYAKLNCDTEKFIRAMSLL